MCLITSMFMNESGSERPIHSPHDLVTHYMCGDRSNTVDNFHRIKCMESTCTSTHCGVNFIKIWLEACPCIDLSDNTSFLSYKKWISISRPSQNGNDLREYVQTDIEKSYKDFYDVFLRETQKYIKHDCHRQIQHDERKRFTTLKTTGTKNKE